MSWLKGPRCGVDNCRSKLWRIVDGQRICQNGHVKEGEIEIGEDEDQMMGTNVIRPSQISQPSSSFQVKEIEIFYGKESIGLLMQSLQFLLRKQIEWMRKEQGLSEEYEKVVQSLWMMVANKIDFYEEEEEKGGRGIRRRGRSGGNGKRSGRTGERAGGERSRNDEITDDEDDDNVSDDNDNTTDEESSKIVSKESEKLLERISYIHTILLCYLGCVVLKIPIYLYDFNRWIYRYQYPYMKGFQLLPDKMKRVMSGFTIQLLTPRITPTSDQLHDSLHNLCKMLYSSYKLILPIPNWKPLLYKMVHDMFMPPDIYLAAEILVEKLNFNMELPRGSVYHKKTDPEMFLMAIVIICMKLCYGFDENNRIPSDNNSFTPGSFQYEWDIYSDMIRKIWVEDETFSDIDEREIIFWKSDKIERYMDWFQDNMIENNEKMDVSRSRLLAMFPLERRKNENNDKIDNVRDYSDWKSTIETTDEVMRALQRTLRHIGGSRSRDDDERSDDKRRAGGHKDRGKTDTQREEYDKREEDHSSQMDIDHCENQDNDKPSNHEKSMKDTQPTEEPPNESPQMQFGDNYESYRLRHELPELMDLLFKTGAKLTGSKEETMKQVVTSLEINCRNVFVGINGGGNRRKIREKEQEGIEGEVGEG